MNSLKKLLLGSKFDLGICIALQLDGEFCEKIKNNKNNRKKTFFDSIWVEEKLVFFMRRKGHEKHLYYWPKTLFLMGAKDSREKYKTLDILDGRCEFLHSYMMGERPSETRHLVPRWMGPIWYKLIISKSIRNQWNCFCDMMLK